MDDPADRMRCRVQLTTDGLKAYVEAVDHLFGERMVGHQILKSLCPEGKAGRTAEVERQHLTIRINIRRYARCTNAFSKKLDDHAQAVALHFVAYNFCRSHDTLRLGITPAMATGLADKVWTLVDTERLINDSMNHYRGQWQAA